MVNALQSDTKPKLTSPHKLHFLQYKGCNESASDDIIIQVALLPNHTQQCLQRPRFFSLALLVRELAFREFIPNCLIQFILHTGYIGGAVLVRLLEHPDVATFEFTALVRSAEKALKLKEIGVNAVVGSLQDLSLLEALASEADIVISMVRK